ncbi:unnamed protein product [Amoebophrya sp. A25]|nr:unnamed protein product [Amoebophrya sp. A25]|eukprot:GSA25T00027185001.1
MNRSASAGRVSPFVRRKGILVEETKRDGTVHVNWRPSHNASPSTRAQLLTPDNKRTSTPASRVLSSRGGAGNHGPGNRIEISRGGGGVQERYAGGDVGPHQRVAGGHVQQHTHTTRSASSSKESQSHERMSHLLRTSFAPAQRTQQHPDLDSSMNGGRQQTQQVSRSQEMLMQRHSSGGTGRVAATWNPNAQSSESMKRPAAARGSSSSRGGFQPSSTRQDSNSIKMTSAAVKRDPSAGELLEGLRRSSASSNGTGIGESPITVGTPSAVLGGHLGGTPVTGRAASAPRRGGGRVSPGRDRSTTPTGGTRKSAPTSGVDNTGISGTGSRKPLHLSLAGVKPLFQKERTGLGVEQQEEAYLDEAADDVNTTAGGHFSPVTSSVLVAPGGRSIGGATSIATGASSSASSSSSRSASATKYYVRAEERFSTLASTPSERIPSARFSGSRVDSPPKQSVGSSYSGLAFLGGSGRESETVGNTTTTRPLQSQTTGTPGFLSSLEDRSALARHFFNWRLSNFRRLQESRDNEHTRGLEIAARYMREARKKEDRLTLEVAFLQWTRNCRISLKSAREHKWADRTSGISGGAGANTNTIDAAIGDLDSARTIPLTELELQARKVVDRKSFSSPSWSPTRKSPTRNSKTTTNTSATRNSLTGGSGGGALLLPTHQRLQQVADMKRQRGSLRGIKMEDPQHDAGVEGAAVSVVEKNEDDQSFSHDQPPKKDQSSPSLQPKDDETSLQLLAAEIKAQCLEEYQAREADSRRRTREALAGRLNRILEKRSLRNLWTAWRRECFRADPWQLSPKSSPKDASFRESRGEGGMAFFRSPAAAPGVSRMSSKSSADGEISLQEILHRVNHDDGEVVLGSPADSNHQVGGTGFSIGSYKRRRSRSQQQQAGGAASSTSSFGNGGKKASKGTSPNAYSPNYNLSLSSSTGQLPSAQQLELTLSNMSGQGSRRSTPVGSRGAPGQGGTSKRGTNPPASSSSSGGLYFQYQEQISRLKEELSASLDERSRLAEAIESLNNQMDASSREAARLADELESERSRAVEGARHAAEEEARKEAEEREAGLVDAWEERLKLAEADKEDRAKSAKEEAERFQALYQEAERRAAGKEEEARLLEQKCEVLSETRKNDREKIRKAQLLDNDRKRQIEKLKDFANRDAEMREEREKIREEKDMLGKRKCQLQSQGKALEALQARLDALLIDVDEQKKNFVVSEKSRLHDAFGAALSRAGDLAQRWTWNRILLRIFHAWRHAVAIGKHEKHQAELQSEFDACTKEWDEQVADRLKQQKDTYDEALEEEKLKLRDRLDAAEKEVKESRLVHQQNSELRGGLVATRTSLSIFASMMRQQYQTLESQVYERLSQSVLHPSESRVVQLENKVREMILLEKRKKMAVMKGTEDVQIGDLYRELKGTYGRLLSAHAAKKRELALCRAELKRQQKANLSSKGDVGAAAALLSGSASATTLHSRATTPTASGAARQQARVTSATANQGVVPLNRSVLSTAASGVPNSASRPSAVGVIGGAAAGGHATTIANLSDLPSGGPDLLNLSSLSCASGGSVRILSLEQQVSTLQQARSRGLLETKALEDRISSLNSDVQGQKTILQKQNRVIWQLRRNVTKYECFSRWCALSVSSRGIRWSTKVALADADAPAISSPSTKETMASSGDESLQMITDAANKETTTTTALSTITKPSAQNLQKHVMCPPLLLRALRRAHGATEMETVRFCYYVWIFAIRERRYEEALRKSNRQLSTECDSLMQRCVETESDLQRALLTKLELEEEVRNVKGALEAHREREAKLVRDAESWKAKHALLSEELQTMQAAPGACSPRVLSIEELGKPATVL